MEIIIERLSEDLRQEVSCFRAASNILNELWPRFEELREEEADQARAQLIDLKKRSMNISELFTLVEHLNKTLGRCEGSVTR